LSGLVINGGASVKVAHYRFLKLNHYPAFYRNVFGAAPQRSASPPRIWFQIGSGRLGLSPVGAGPGVDHFCLAVSSHDDVLTAKMLQDRGATIEAGDTPGAEMFLDPDGIRVQVTSAKAAAK
jgi:hypothetical protein